MSEIDVTGDLLTEFLTTITQQGPGADVQGGLRPLNEKTYPEIQQFKVEVLPNEGKHRGRPHCKVTTDKGAVSVDIETGDIIAGKADRWATAIGKAVKSHKAGLQKLWKESRPDDQKVDSANEQ